MKTVIFGGAGFVGLNIAEHLLTQGAEVHLFDRLPVPDTAREAFAALPGRLAGMQGDVTDESAISSLIVPGTDTVVLGAAVTADAARETRDPQGILQVNLMALTPILRACREAGVRRVINLSSAAAYGHAAIGLDGAARVGEDTPPRPAGLYGITKFTSEMIGERMAQLWGLDFVSLRLSAVFGPWERATGARDTTSPLLQITEDARAGRATLLARPGYRDWVYGPDVAAAVAAVMRAERLAHRVYNVSTPEVWSALAWGEALAALRPGYRCRLAGPGETHTAELHAAVDRAALCTDRLRDELGWSAAYDLHRSVTHLDAWTRRFELQPGESS